MSSIFSKIIQRDIPAYIVAEDRSHIAFLDIAPVAKGHLLVLPKEEVDRWTDLSPERLSKLMTFAQCIGKALEQAMPCQRVALSIIGMEVPHVHVHLIPIQKEEDAYLNQPALNISRKEMEAIAEQIQQAVKTQFGS